VLAISIFAVLDFSCRLVNPLVAKTLRRRSVWATRQEACEDLFPGLVWLKDLKGTATKDAKEVFDWRHVVGSTGSTRKNT
jgi:hypothetical protein